MTEVREVIVKGEPVEKAPENKENIAGLAGYDPKKDPNSGHWEGDEGKINLNPPQNIKGLAPSVATPVDDPTHPLYQNPGASDFLHAPQQNVYVNPDGALHVTTSEVIVKSEERELKEKQIPKDSVPLSVAVNPVISEDDRVAIEKGQTNPVGTKDREKETAKVEKEESKIKGSTS